MPLVLLTPEFGARQFVDRFSADRKLRARTIVLEMNAIEPILSTIRNSGLASVLSIGAVPNVVGLRIVRLVEPVPERTVGILWRRDGHRSARSPPHGRDDQGRLRQAKKAPAGERPIDLIYGSDNQNTLDLSNRRPTLSMMLAGQ